MTSILKLKVGDAVRDYAGLRGVVFGFTRDRVRIEWDENPAPISYTDADLAKHGIAKVSPFDAEDTIPG